MIKYLFKKQETIGGATILLAFFTIFAQILGIIKNKIFSVKFGASQDLDIFYTAFKIPDIIFLLVGTIAVGSILIPIFNQKEKKSVLEEQEYMAKFFNSFSLLIVGISLITFLFLPIILKNIFPAFEGDAMEKLLSLSRLFLLSPILIGISNFFISINQKNKIFLPMALTGLFYNLWIILGALFLAPKFGIFGVAYGVILGSLSHLLIQLPSIFKNNLFSYKLKFFDKKESFNLFKITFPRSVALSISTIILVYFYSAISDLKVDGLITIFTFAFSVFWIPVALLNSSYSGASLPVLAKFYSQGKMDDFKKLIENLLSQILFFAIPVAAFFFAFSDLIVATLFGSQKFMIKEINSTATMLSLFSLMVVFQVLMLVISRIFYSMGKTKPVMYVNIFAAIIIIFLFSIFDYLNFNYLNKVDYVAGFSELFKMTLIFVVSYILASLLIINKLIKILKGKNIFNFSRLMRKIMVSFFAIVVLRLGWSKLNFNFSLNDGENILNIIFVGFLFIFLFIIFSELFREETYLKFKKKVFK